MSYNPDLVAFDRSTTTLLNQLFARTEARDAVRRWWLRQGVDVASFATGKRVFVDVKPLVDPTLRLQIRAVAEAIEADPERGPNGDFIIGTIK